jgi:hypothetical protein
MAGTADLYDKLGSCADDGAPELHRLGDRLLGQGARPRLPAIISADTSQLAMAYCGLVDVCIR